METLPVQMDADTSGNPWKLSIDNAQRLSPAILSPNNIQVILDEGVSTTYSGNNFTFSEAAAEINGTVKDENGNLLIGTDVYINGNFGSFNRNVRTDNTGTFESDFFQANYLLQILTLAPVTQRIIV